MNKVYMFKYKRLRKKDGRETWYNNQKLIVLANDVDEAMRKSLKYMKKLEDDYYEYKIEEVYGEVDIIDFKEVCEDTYYLDGVLSNGL